MQPDKIYPGDPVPTADQSTDSTQDQGPEGGPRLHATLPVPGTDSTQDQGPLGCLSAPER